MIDDDVPRVDAKTGEVFGRVPGEQPVNHPDLRLICHPKFLAISPKLCLTTIRVEAQ